MEGGAYLTKRLVGKMKKRYQRERQELNSIRWIVLLRLLVYQLDVWNHQPRESLLLLCS